MNEDPQYEVRYPSANNKIGILHAYNMEEAREFVRIFPDSIIVRREDRAWMDIPLSTDRRGHLAKIHCILHCLVGYDGSSSVRLPAVAPAFRETPKAREPYQELIGVWKAAKEYLDVASELIPDHIATDPDHEYGRAEDTLRKTLNIEEKA